MQALRELIFISKRINFHFTRIFEGEQKKHSQFKDQKVSQKEKKGTSKEEKTTKLASYIIQGETNT